MHSIKITHNLLFEYQCTAANLSDCRIESKKSIRYRESNRVESKLFLPELECSIGTARDVVARSA